MKKIPFSLIALIIACTGAFATKAGGKVAFDRSFVPIDEDITVAANYIYAPIGTCNGFGTSFCGIKAPDMQGTPDIGPALLRDLIAIKNGSNPVSNTSGQVRFYQ
ncbi:hypothetical protein [Chitinophaga pinensis]|uniref:Uncharacterized protein n=1 Tax=Chitinophaga pinensis (strain ATCC 43595 / DSM 2588 / LMG 13176 / NBRC 15968 / NCIMB 11800 / UQM 2034) TaxID=485918 RepID=A0A979G7G0_CHIPD|nr:hypothetical protein [Chitinophaga pinensis]ACU62127.1 hypothetical protein Cpin_4690 [Chitinophaga pinensis DSM 2588]